MISGQTWESARHLGLLSNVLSEEDSTQGLPTCQGGDGASNG